MRMTIYHINRQGAVINMFNYFKKAAQGIIISLIVLGVVFAFNRDVVIGQLFLYETMPNYKTENIAFFKLEQNIAPAEQQLAVVGNFEQSNSSFESFEEKPNKTTTGDIIGVNDVIYQPETDITNTDNHFHEQVLNIENVSQFKDIESLKKNLYIVDKRTNIDMKTFDIEAFANADLSIGKGKKILVFNTHSNEMFKDSIDKSEGVVGLSKLLCKTLTEKYGIEAMYAESNFDTIDGKSHIPGAYERMEPKIKQILQENPDIEVVIDIHRDGVDENKRFVTTIDGKPTAQIMFFNGLSKLNENGVLKDITSLPNPNLQTNLAFSFQMQMAANNMYSGISRKIYLNAYRYSLHMMPKSLFIEIGAQTNTKEEAFNTVEPIAKMLAEVLNP